MRRRWLPLVLFMFALAVAAPAALADTIPDGSSQGPRVASYDPSFMQSEAAGDDACETLIEEGWSLVNPSDLTTPRRLEGEVVAGHTPHGDFYFNHDTEDYDFFVMPDNHNPLATNTETDYRYMLGKGNFVTGEPKEHGRIEVEGEYGAHTWNDAADKGYYGMPTWVWPNIGDRVLTEGFWIFDCGHEPFRTEIHPAWMVVTYRNTMQSLEARQENRKGWFAPLGADNRDFSPVTRADVWISSFGGEAVDNIFDDDDFFGRKDWWQPVNSKDYDFDILAPAKPSPDAVLTTRILDPPSGPWIRPPGASEPAFDSSNLTQFTRPDGKVGVHVHIPFSSVPDADYLLFAKTIVVGWDVHEENVRHFRVTFKHINIFDDLEGVDEAEYSAWAHSGDLSLFVRNSDGDPGDDPPEYDCDSDGNYMPYCEPDNNEINIMDASFDRFLGPEDALVISFRAKESDQPLDENDDAGFADASYTAAEDWGVGTHYVRQQDMTWSGEYKDVTNDLIGGGDDPCDDEGPDDADTCYEVKYTIERIFDPTALTIGVPTVQYAMDPNDFTAKVVTPDSPDIPRRRLPVTINLSGPGGSQTVNGTTGDDGVAAPHTLLTLPAGGYTDVSTFAGNGLLSGSTATTAVTIVRDLTASSISVPDNKLRWGHNDPITVGLIEPNVGQSEPALPVVGKNMTVTLTGPLGTQTYPAGPTSAAGSATITPLMSLPPGNYQATACFAQDAWFEASCSAPLTVKVTGGFAAFMRGGPVTVSGTAQTTRGDLHSEGAVVVSGNTHVLSAGAGERLEYVTTFTDTGTGSIYNLFHVPALGIAPQYLQSTYCSGASTLMGVPVTYFAGNHTFPNDAVLTGIYCVGGDVKLQARVTGTAVVVATGKITTSGSAQSLTTADPTGADVVLFSGSGSLKAIQLGSDEHFTGTIVAAGGLEFSGSATTVVGSLIGETISLSGSHNTLDGR